MALRLISGPLYCLSGSSETLDFLKDFIKEYQGSRLHVLCPAELELSLGPAYWHAQEDYLSRLFPQKPFIFWHDFGDMAGYALGALRLGICHLVFSGPTDTYIKLQDIARQRSATILPSVEAICRSLSGI